MTHSAENDAGLTPQQRDRFVNSALGALRVRHQILLLASHATGHRQQAGSEACADCKDDWPCSAVLRAAAPSLDAVADLPSVRVIPPEVQS